MRRSELLDLPSSPASSRIPRSPLASLGVNLTSWTISMRESSERTPVGRRMALLSPKVAGSSYQSYFCSLKRVCVASALGVWLSIWYRLTRARWLLWPELGGSWLRDASRISLPLPFPRFSSSSGRVTACHLVWVTDDHLDSSRRGFLEEENL